MIKQLVMKRPVDAVKRLGLGLGQNRQDQQQTTKEDALGGRG
jgi:hypothetical protein